MPVEHARMNYHGSRDGVRTPPSEWHDGAVNGERLGRFSSSHKPQPSLHHSNQPYEPAHRHHDSIVLDPTVHQSSELPPLPSHDNPGLQSTTSRSEMGPHDINRTSEPPVMPSGDSSLPPDALPPPPFCPHVRSPKPIKEGDWACVPCGNINFAKRTKCNVCQAPKPKCEDALDDSPNFGGPPGLFKKGDWPCTHCGNVNWARREKCNMCNSPKPSGGEEPRLGRGGGHFDLQDPSDRNRHDSDGEDFDEFGRKKKKRKRESNSGGGVSAERSISQSAVNPRTFNSNSTNTSGNSNTSCNYSSSSNNSGGSVSPNEDRPLCRAGNFMKGRHNSMDECNNIENTVPRENSDEELPRRAEGSTDGLSVTGQINYRPEMTSKISGLQLEVCKGEQNGITSLKCQTNLSPRSTAECLTTNESTFKEITATKS